MPLSKHQLTKIHQLSNPTPHNETETEKQQPEAL